MLMTRAGGGADESAPAADASATPTASASGATAPAPATGGSTIVPAAPACPPGEFEAGPGLPAPVVAAYERGDAVVLLITKRRGIEDRPVEQAVLRLNARGDVTAFTTRAKNIARYARITRGVNVARV